MNRTNRAIRRHPGNIYGTFEETLFFGGEDGQVVMLIWILKREMGGMGKEERLWSF